MKEAIRLKYRDFTELKIYSTFARIGRYPGQMPQMTQEGTESMRKRKFYGQALPEYGLLLGLLAVAAIAALTFLGQDISKLLGKVGSAEIGTIALLKSGSKTAASVAPPSTSTTPTQTAPTETAAPPPAQQSGPIVKAAYDPNTKRIVFDGLDAATDGTNSTSVEGTKLAAQYLMSLAENATMPDGQPIPDELSGLIRNLANAGLKYADGEAMIDAKGSAATAEDYETVFAAGYVGDAYDALNKALGRYPELQGLSQEIYDATGVITSIGVYNYYANLPYFISHPSAFDSYPKSMITGTNLATTPVSLDSSILTTQQAAGQIGALATYPTTTSPTVSSPTTTTKKK